MSQIWYTGGLDRREINAADWNRMGAPFTGTPTMVWNSANKFSQSASGLPQAVVDWFATQSDFMYVPTDTFPVDVAGPEVASPPATQAYVISKVQSMVDSTETPNLARLKSAIPSLEELIWPSRSLGDVNATKTYLLGSLPMFSANLTVLQIVCGTSLAVSDVDYYTFEIGRYRNAAYSVIATTSTQATGGQAITANQSFGFMAVSWSAVNRAMVMGDVLALKITKTGAPAALVDVVITGRYSPASIAPFNFIVLDDFNRPDGVLSGSVASGTGQAWNAASGVLSNVVGNQLSVPPGGQPYVDIGLTSGYRVIAKMTNSQVAGISVRLSAANNMIAVSGSTLTRYATGGNVTLINFGSAGVVGGDEIWVDVLSNDLIIVYRNGGEIGRATDATFNTMTKVGIRNSGTSGGAATFDYFQVVGI